MELKINNDEFWNKLLAGEKSIPENWGLTCRNSIRRQKAEIAKKYNIRFGQTTIFCARCGIPCWPGQHLCQDLALIKARETRSAKAAQVEADKLTQKENLLQLREDHENILAEIQDFGIKKLSTLMEIPKITVSKWIERGNVPNSRLEKVIEMLRGV